ncbi:hypothetical protein A6R68_09382 [Neotoma lepida]|uniref:Meteorin-like protein n=1 Tax=Neotoma lepida TaxID=56216 RepID=A0A1A6G0W9_NEOLE|nr:hypothetical protein A6R68_09382 [Neotoma lepida]
MCCLLNVLLEDVTHVPEQQVLAIYLHVSRQESRVFQPAPEGGGHWLGHVITRLECAVLPGHGEFSSLDMHTLGSKAGCAPRFSDFQRMYRNAEERGINPCEINMETSWNLRMDQSCNSFFLKRRTYPLKTECFEKNEAIQAAHDIMAQEV